jgi:hypothetical protein
VDEIIVVDGGSSDDTVAVAREIRPDAVVLRQTRYGRGNALVCGFAASSGDIVVTLHADGSTDPGEIPRYVEALRAGAEVAHGSRYRDGGRDLAARRLDRLGNAVLCWLVNVLFGTRFTDLGCGYIACWRGLLPTLDLPAADLAGLPRGRTVRGDGPEIEPLINIRMAAQGLRVVEVASVGYPPIHGERPRRPLRRLLGTLRILISEHRRRRRLGRRPSAPARHDATTLPRYAETTGSRRPSAQRGDPPPADRMVRPPAEDPASYVAGERSTGRHAAPAGMTSNPASRRRMEAPDPGPAPRRWTAAADQPAARRAPTGRRQGYPAPAPWTTPEPGAHRTQDITEYDTGQPRTGVRRSGIYDTGVHHLKSERVAPPDSGVHRTGVYDTGARRSGLYDTGVHRVGVYDSGVHRTDVYDTGAHHLPEDADNPLYRQDAPRDVGGGRRRLDARDRRSDDRPDLTVIPGDGSTDPGRAAQDRADQDRAAQDRTARDRAAQDRADQDRADQDRAAQDRAAQDRAGRDQAGRARTEPERRDQGRRGQERRAHGRGDSAPSDGGRADGGRVWGGAEPGGWEPELRRRPGHLRALPGERFTR